MVMVEYGYLKTRREDVKAFKEAQLPAIKAYPDIQIMVGGEEKTYRGRQNNTQEWADNGCRSQ